MNTVMKIKLRAVVQVALAQTIFLCLSLEVAKAEEVSLSTDAILYITCNKAILQNKTIGKFIIKSKYPTLRFEAVEIARRFTPSGKILTKKITLNRVGSFEGVLTSIFLEKNFTVYGTITAVNIDLLNRKVQRGLIPIPLSSVLCLPLNNPPIVN
jgi:hypothetical protein